MSIEFPDDYNFIFPNLFGNTPRVKILEFFIATSNNNNNPWSYISQISRLIKLSKSSVKNAIENLLQSKILIEKKIETHAKNPQRNLRLNKDNNEIKELIRFYKSIK